MAREEKPDMFMTMLSRMVGIPPQEFKSIIEGFIYTARNMGAQMDRIEANQLAMIEAMNDDRKRDGRPLIGYTDTGGIGYDNSGNPTGTKTTS